MSFNTLKNMICPGRIIIGGTMLNGARVAFYAITARSNPSRVRYLKTISNKIIAVDVTDPKQLEDGDEALLLYNAIRIESGHLIVSNGAQTDAIASIVKSAVDMNMSMSNINHIFRRFRANSGEYTIIAKDGRIIDLTTYEPDPPNNTPRITAILGRHSFIVDIVAKGETSDKPLIRRSLHGHSNVKGTMICTYSGEHAETPLPSFKKKFVPIILPWDDLSDGVSDIYEALGPKNGDDDLRVSVVGVRFAPGVDQFLHVYIKNRFEPIVEAEVK